MGLARYTAAFWIVGARNTREESSVGSIEIGKCGTTNGVDEVILGAGGVLGGDSIEYGARGCDSVRGRCSGFGRERIGFRYCCCISFRLCDNGGGDGRCRSIRNGCAARRLRRRWSSVRRSLRCGCCRGRESVHLDFLVASHAAGVTGFAPGPIGVFEIGRLVVR